jgi:DNA helicase-4
MFVSEFQEIVAGLQRIERNLLHLQKLQKIRSILKIVGIGFFIYKNIDSEIDSNKRERQILLENSVQKTSEYLEYFRNESKFILESNNYLAKDDETRLLSLLNEFDRDVRYLIAQPDIVAQISNSLGAIAEIRKFVTNYNSEFEAKKLRAELLAHKDEVLQAVTEFDSLFFGNYYFSKKEFHDWKNKWLQLKGETEKCVRKVGSDSGFKDELNRFLNAYQSGEDWLKNRNKEFVEKEALKYKDFFEKVESDPLTSEQKKAILVDEANILVVAGAGTGKTSTVLGKAGYLLKKGLAKPNEILLLSFNKDVKLELEKRIKKSKMPAELEPKTYHSFGLRVIAHATKTTPALFTLAEDKTKFIERVFGFIIERMKDPSFARMINEYFLYHLIPYKSEFEFESFGDYIRYLKQYDLRSLKGDKVKSFEECYIANFLYVNGIDYLYEADYEKRTATENHRQYKPDFYLPKYKIYIEHFGINRERKPAPYISEREYTRQMKWKKETHELNKTTLIQTFSYEQKEGVLLSNLEMKLREKGVTLSPIPADQIFTQLNSMGKTRQLPELLCNFLNLYKESGKSIQQIQSEVDPEDTRTRAFLKIFSAVYDDYTSCKAEEIDFSDMLNDAAKYINEGKYVSNFKYILVDEFQDISRSRYLFLKALADQNTSKLFCVGDDWQSIYRFTGSDISLMVDFQKKFEFGETLFLQETFRFDDKMCDFSSRFILQNPLQIKKNITSRTLKTKPAISVIREKTAVALKDIIFNLSKNSEHTETVFVVGRYNHLEQEYLGNFPRRVGFLRIEYTTAHSSKGLEAEYVVILGLNGGKLGFPCQITDDPILNLVLARKEEFPNAEERRLFYVAVTRAKKHVFLIDDPDFNSSSFTIEVLNGNYEVESIGQLPKTDLCPVCGTGELVQKQSAHGLFYSCSNYPYCDYIPKQCPECGVGFLHKGKYVYKCSNKGCSFRADICPVCDDGYLVKRTSRKRAGFFFGCTNYPNCRYIKRPDTSRGYIR